MLPDAIIDLHYFPSIDFFTYMLGKRSVVVEICSYYEKQTGRNRCYVLGANQVQRLSIPVMKTEAAKVPYAQVRIDYRQRWQDNHWRTIYSAYGKAPYFEHYADELKAAIYSGEEYLVQLNLKMLTLCLYFLKMPVNISVTTHYQKSYEGTLKDMRGRIAYLPDDTTDRKGYIQLFGQKFVHNLSILDLLFCEGAQSVCYLQQNLLEMQ
ncbi:WbqC family protein [Rhodoflexus sp.]